MKKYILIVLFNIFILELSAQRVIFNVNYDSFEFKVLKIDNSLLFKNRFGNDSNFSILSDSMFYFNALNRITAVNLNNVKTAQIGEIAVYQPKNEKMKNIVVDSWTSFNPFLALPKGLTLPYKILSDTNSKYELFHDSIGYEENRISYNIIANNTSKPHRIMYTFYFDRKRSVWYAMIHIFYYNYAWTMINCNLSFLDQKIWFRNRTYKKLHWKQKSKKMKLIRAYRKKTI